MKIRPATISGSLIKLQFADVLNQAGATVQIYHAKAKDYVRME